MFAKDQRHSSTSASFTPPRRLANLAWLVIIFPTMFVLLWLVVLLIVFTIRLLVLARNALLVISSTAMLVLWPQRLLLTATFI